MYDVRIPEGLYQQATNAARAEHVSLEEFVLDAVQRRLNGPRAVTLSPEQMVQVREAQASIKAGKFLTIEQLDQRSAANRAQWLKENQP